MNQGRHGAGVGHVTERARRGLARQRLIAFQHDFTDLTPRGLRREVPELVKLGEEQMVYAEATVALPLVAGYAFHKGAWRARTVKNYAKLFATAAAQTGD